MFERDDSTSLAKAGRVSAPVWFGLTKKQENFALLVAEGLNLSAAYRESYDTSRMSAQSVWREAHRLSRNRKVAERIAELVAVRQREQRIEAILREYRVVAHLEAAMQSANSDSIRLRAAELLGKTVGLFSGKPETIQQREFSLLELEAELERLVSRKEIG